MGIFLPAVSDSVRGYGKGTSFFIPLTDLKQSGKGGGARFSQARALGLSKQPLATHTHTRYLSLASKMGCLADGNQSTVFSGLLQVSS